MSYCIRRAGEHDLDRLVTLLLSLQDHIEASNPSLWRMTEVARSHLKSQLAARLTAPNSCSIVAERHEGGIAGVIFGRVVTNKRYSPSRAGLVDQIYVQADQRRTGMATALVAEMCRFFADEGVGDLSLRYVVGNEEAAGFWTALGFSPRIITAGATREAVEHLLAERRI